MISSKISLLARAERAELAVAIVQNADGRGESKLDSAVRHGQSILGVAHAAAENRIDIHLKLGVLGEKLELLVEHLEAFFRDVIRLHVVDADLQIFEPGAIEALDAVGHEQVAVGDQAGHDAVLADAGDDGVQIGMQQRLAAADRDDGGAHCSPRRSMRRNISSSGHGLGKIVEFVAVGAGQIAAAHGNDMHQQGMPRGSETLGEHPDLAQLAVRGEQFPANFLAGIHQEPRAHPANLQRSGVTSDYAIAALGFGARKGAGWAPQAVAD